LADPEMTDGNGKNILLIMKHGRIDEVMLN